MYTYRPLRELLKRRGMSIRTMRLGIGLSTNVSVAITSDKPITIDNIALICQYLDVPIEEVIEVFPAEDA